MAAFTVFAGSDTSTLTTALFAPGSGISASNIVLQASGQEAVNFYDGSLTPLGIGAGLLLTSGTTPGTTNTVAWFGQDNSALSGSFNNGDADIDAVVNTVFQTQSYDATTLSFDFSVADPGTTSISFDLVFGSDEYPEWVDQFVDSAIVMVNGVNYALFNHDPAHPLSVVSANLAAGYFQDNGGGALPIEYDGVSHVLKIVAPIVGGGAINHIKIGIADTGDHIYDSGVFLANFSAGNIPGSGVVIAPSGNGTDGADNLSGSAKDEYFDLQGGDDSCYAGAGDDIIVAGSGNDVVFGGSGADQLKGDAGDDLLDGGDGSDTAVFGGASSDYLIAYDAATGGFTVTGSGGSGVADGVDTLSKIELAKFSDGLFALGAGGLTPVGDPATPPANSAGAVAISGIGALGKTLTASVSDPDGIAGAVSYQWQVSADDGASWSVVGSDSNSYTVGAGDLGMAIRVLASYVDNGANAETPVSATKQLLAGGGGDLVVTLMQLDAPLGSTVINPLTTLVQDAIELGLTANLATTTIKTVLGIPDAISLQTYDAWAVLQGNPNDATALAVEKVAVQVAILTSLSDDDSGAKLTLAIVDAAAAGKTLDLANVDDLSTILGIPAVIDPATGKYPQPLREIFDRNSAMSDAIADGGDVSVIEAEWQDLLSINDGIASTSIADLSIHVNQAPTGTPAASLADGVAGSPYLIAAADLLQGFSDPDGGVLAVAGLGSDGGGTLVDNLDGSWTFVPVAGYSGPVELSYTVLDGQGGSTAASQLFVIAAAAANTPPAGSATATLADGSEDSPYVVSAATLLAGFSDADGDPLQVVGLSASNGNVVTNLDGSFTITPAADFNGPMSLGYTVDDGHGGSIAATQSLTLAAVNDAPTSAGLSSLIVGFEDSPLLLGADSLLAGFSDVDGDPLSVSGLFASSGTIVDNLDGTFTLLPAANFNGPLTLAYSVTDGHGGSIDALQNVTLLAVNDAPTGSATATLADGTEDSPYVVSAATLLAGFSDADGDPLQVIGLSASNGNVVTNLDGSFTITPAADFNGPMSLGYTVDDGHGGSVAATQSLSFAAVNDAPTSAGLSSLIVGFEDSPLLLGADSLLAGFSDVDGDPLGVSGLFASSGTIVDNLDGTFTLLPAANFNGPLTLAYSVTDGHGGSVDALQNVTLLAVNDAPTGSATATLADGSEDSPYVVSAATLLAGFSDADGDPLQVVGLGVSNGSVSAGPAGSFTINPGANFNGPLTLDYMVSDGHGGSIAATLGLTLAAVNDAPTGAASATLPAGTVNTPYVVGAAALLAGFSDVDGDTLSVAGLSTADGSVSANADGSFTILPNAGFSGSLTLAYSVLDGQGGSIGATQQLTIAAAVSGVTVTGSNGADSLSGGDGDDTIYGLGGNDTLDGRGGSDQLLGGNGNDSYYVDAAGDVVSEAAGAGNDLVVATVSYALAANVERLTLAGSADLAATGNAQANVLTGNAGSNLLDGGAGNDRLVGGDGDDTYLVDSAADLVVEAAGAGIDNVVASTASYRLGNHVENLTLAGPAAITGIGNQADNALTGNANANLLKGLGGDDRLDGGDGRDTLDGGDGDDLLAGGAGADLLEGGSGHDTALFTGSLADYRLALNPGHRLSLERGGVTDTLHGIETVVFDNGTADSADDTSIAVDATPTGLLYNLPTFLADVLHGGDADDVIDGLGGSDTITGGAGDDSLYGGCGNDTLNGGAGRDILAGGLGSDRFVFDTAPAADNADLIRDFGAGDRILLDHDVFSELAVGGLAKGVLHFGTAAHDASDRLVYDKASGNLFYDADGNGNGEAMLIATLGSGAHPALTAGSFGIIA